MISSSKLELIAQVLQPLGREWTRKEVLCKDIKWESEPGLQYADVMSGMLKVSKPILDNVGAEIFADVGFEAIRLPQNGYLKPHYHQLSDSVIYCIDDGRDNFAYDAYFEFEGKPLWLELSERRVIQIPRGTPHGFRQTRGVAITNPLIFIAATFPPIAEGDTHYL